MLAFACLTGLVGCSAKYETFYEYNAPQNDDVQNCVSYCKISLERCQKYCPKSLGLCSNSHETLYMTQCEERPCECDKDYRACYQMCGGKVIKKERCIANCDK